VLERTLDARVERVEAVERERLRRAEAPPGALSAPWWVSTQWASASRFSLLIRARARVEQLLAERDVAEQPALLGERDRAP
jgi:hypothetical protein